MLVGGPEGNPPDADDVATVASLAMGVAMLVCVDIAGLWADSGGVGVGVGWWVVAAAAVIVL